MSDNIGSPASPFGVGEAQNVVPLMSPSASSSSSSSLHNNGIRAGPSHHHHHHQHNNVVSEPSYNYGFISGRVPTFEYNDPIALNLIKEQVS